MAAGKINLQANDTRIYEITAEDGAAGNVAITLPKEGGVLTSDAKVVHKTGDETIAGVKTFSSSPIVPTPTVGDNSTKVATTAFVKTKGVEYSTIITTLSSYTATSSDIGKTIIVSNGSTNETVTLPSVASVPVGAVVSILNVNTKGWTIKGSGAEQIYYGASIANTIVLDGYNSFTCINRGDYWFVLGGGASSLGAGQGWVDVTGSRVPGTTYTNTTSKPIYVVVKYSAGGAGNYVSIATDGIIIDQSNSSTASTIYAVGLIAPQKSYSAYAIGGALAAWYEFR